MKADFFNRKKINLDITHRCTLQCKACTRHYLLSSGKKVPGHDMTDYEFDLVLEKFENFIFCGNISDPIFHPNFPGFLKKIYDADKHAWVATSASQRPRAWYKRAFEANPTATWVFGIDGLPHQSHMYRINQDGEHLFEMMLMAKEMGIDARWQFIIFSYNEDRLEEAQMLAASHDIKMLITRSGRFPADEPWMEPKGENTHVRF